MFILHLAMGRFGYRPVFIPQPIFIQRPVFIPQPVFAPMGFNPGFNPGFAPMGFNPGFAFGGGAPVPPMMFAQAGGGVGPVLAPGAIPEFPAGLADPLPRPAALAGVGGAGAPPAPTNLPVPGNQTIPATATIVPGGTIVQYRDGAGAGPHRVGVRPAGGGAIQWFDIDDARLGLNANAQGRISSSALLARQMGVTVRPDGTCIQFGRDGNPPIIYDFTARDDNGYLVSRAIAGRAPRLVYGYNPGGAAGTQQVFVQTTAAGVPVVAAPGATIPAAHNLTPAHTVTAGSNLERIGLVAGSYYYVSTAGATQHTIQVFNPGTDAWETPGAPIIPGAAVNGVFANGTFRSAGAGGLRPGDAFYRIPPGRPNAGNFFILNQAGTQYRIVNSAGNAVGGPGWIAIPAGNEEFQRYREHIQNTRATTGVNPAD